MPTSPVFSSTPPSPESPEETTRPPETTPNTTTTATAEPPRVTVGLPRVARRRQPLDPLPATATVEDAGDVEPAEQAGPSASTSSAPRTTSSAGDPPVDPKIVAGAIAAVIGIAATLAAAVLVRLPRPRELRRPTDEDRAAIAAPLARIARRHVPAAALGPDLLDVIDVAGATSAYISDGPLTYSLAPVPTLDDDTTPEG